MFTLQCKGWSWDKDLQIIHADVYLEVDGEVLIDEPLCVDVGLPALLYSIYRDVEPNRWASPDDCFRMPFFCCGCGDPECRAFSFRARHLNEGMLELTEIEERQHAEPRILGTYLVPLEAYKTQIIPIALEYLSFVKGLEYRPYYTDTTKVVEQLVKGVY
ncbi:hypothetical protein GC093_21550 [Paenibacillus sp. LMG 31456]|uniref:Uncharacterized protein n=1 Tax=Paenibacillus foliorum TaxID=2654974 RepID=A0A972GT01_9BACL|nr:hypothetical protein [Paenibacillus foliorum]NOU95788.1 hypothetical protein [Paenibacillus foliorum]